MARYLAILTLVVAVAAVSEAGGHHAQGGAGEEMEENRMARSGRGQWGGNADQGGYGNQPGGRGQWGKSDDQMARGQQSQGGWQQGSGGRQSGSDSRYTANIFDDEDVYGYEAKYPNGEALYVNYRNSDARARRGPGFARSNSISARNNGMSSGGYQADQGGFRSQRSGQSMPSMSMHGGQPQQW